MSSKIEKEKQIVELMIALYCRHNHNSAKGTLCTECADLVDYAKKRLSKCKFGENKTSCKKCPVHCYKPEMREKIRNVMRWSGPRMILYNPLAAIKHALS